MADINQLSCAGGISNLGRCDCNQIITAPEYLVFTTGEFEFATKAAAIVQANWQSGIQSKQVFPLGQVLEQASADTEDGTYSSANGHVTIPTSKGKWVKTYFVQATAFLIRKLYTLNGKSGRLFLTDGQGNTLCTTPDETKIQGLYVKNIRVGKPMLPDTKDDILRVGITFEFSNLDEYTKDLAVITVDFADELNALLDATVTYVSSNVGKTEHTITVAKVCDGSAVSGLVTADFLLTDDTPSAESFTAAESGTVPGTYVLTTSALGADNYIVNLNIPSVMTTDGYESTGAATFTLS